MNWQLIKNTDEIITLPADLRWIDELDWQNLAQTEGEYSLSGALIIQQNLKTSGRRITLAGDWVWLEKSSLEELQNWADIPELVLQLKHPDQRIFNVCFSRPAIENFSPVAFIAPEERSAYYFGGTINLITI